MKVQVGDNSSNIINNIHKYECEYVISLFKGRNDDEYIGRLEG